MTTENRTTTIDASEFPGLLSMYRDVKKTEGADALQRGITWLEEGGRLKPYEFSFPKDGL